MRLTFKDLDGIRGSFEFCHRIPLLGCIPVGLCCGQFTPAKSMGFSLLSNSLQRTWAFFSSTDGSEGICPNMRRFCPTWSFFVGGRITFSCTIFVEHPI